MKKSNNILVLKDKKILLMFNRKVASLALMKYVRQLVNSDKTDKKIFNILPDKPITEYKGFTKVLVVRDPYSRILSAYNDNLSYPIVNHSFDRCLLNIEERIALRKKRKKLRKKDNKLMRNIRIPFVEFVDKICNIPDEKANKHFRSQTFDWEEFTPDIIIKLEDMKGWDELDLPTLPVHHESKIKIVTTIPTDLKKKIKERFKKDFELLNYK